MTFQDRLRDCRKQWGLTQKQAAALFSIGERHWRAYELGTRHPSTKTLHEIANYFNVSLDYLEGRTDDPAATAESPMPAFFSALFLILAPLHISVIRELTNMELVYQAHSGIINVAFLVSAVMVLTSVFSKISKAVSSHFESKQAEKEKSLQRAQIAEMLLSLPQAEAELLDSFVDSTTRNLFLSGDDLAARGLADCGIIAKGERQEAQVLVFEAPEYAFSLNPEHAGFIRSEWAKINAARFNKHNRKKKK